MTTAIDTLLAPHAAAVLDLDGAVPEWSADDAALDERIAALTTLPSEAALHELAVQLKPWRKGPWVLPATGGSLTIDAEWRADWKWERLAALLPDLADKRVVDVGCGNGYYLRRMLDAGPRVVLGIDPQAKAVLQWRLARRLGQLRGEAVWERACLKRWRLGALDALPAAFDVVLCAGLLYHVTDAIGALRTLRKSLASGGAIVLETIVVPGDEPVAWTPPRRYAGARGFWALPTWPCLRAWIERAGLKVDALSPAVPTTPEEQRATEWTFGGGIRVGLDPDDPTQTIEGLPAPMRRIVRIVPSG